MFEDADRDPSLLDRGALNFVVVGGGPTGVEMAGALADLIHDTMTAEYHDLAVSAARIHLVDLGHVLLAAFSEKAHDYVAKVLQRKGVELHLGVAVTEVGAGHVDAVGRHARSATRCVVWGGGIKARRWPRVGPRAGRGGRIDVQPDLTVDGRAGRLRDRRRRQHPRPGRPHAARSSARWRCRAATGRPTTCSPTSPASRASRSTTTTRASWR